MSCAMSFEINLLHLRWLLQLLLGSANDIPTLYKILSNLGWVSISIQIKDYKDSLRFYWDGISLTTFSINCIDEVVEIKLSRKTLEQGTECLKQLTEIKIDEIQGVTKEQKGIIIIIGILFKQLHLVLLFIF